jgi:bacteriorhodopsin
MNRDLSIIPIWAWIVLAVVLLTQSVWVFNDASKRGMNQWLWGVFALLNTPTNLIVYLIVSRSVLGSRKCAACRKRYNKNYAYCPYCGAENDNDQ